MSQDKPAPLADTKPIPTITTAVAVAVATGGAYTSNDKPLPPPEPQIKEKIKSPINRGKRLFFFFSLALGMAAINTWLFADLLWRLEWSMSRTFIVTVFLILSFAASFGCLHAIYGWLILRLGDRGRITQLHPWEDASIVDAATAIVVPIYNEDVVRVFEGLRVMYESVQATGHGKVFDFFILSDSTDPAKWVQEEQKWFEICKELGSFAHIHYRRRNNNIEKKSGNIRDFLNAWGKRYRYMVVLDADSVMKGDVFVSLVKMMQVNPTVGLIQTVPGLINNESLFGRMQQFSSRCYGPIFVSGLNYWMQDGGNYWGHNAIIRVEPFMAYCDLPHLPGNKPFGGHILSHDFVEAALLRKEDWEVWLAWDLDGSYEEGPQGLIEFAQRDRRWCQGNLQHAALLFAKGFRTISKVHLFLGILGYCASPLWLTFMLLYVWIKFYGKVQTSFITGLSELPPVAATNPLLKNFSMIEHGLLVFGISMGIIFLPKIIAILDLCTSRARARQHGGAFRGTLSIILETLFSALHAPILMLFHSWFVVTILLGQGVNWGPQKRAADGTAWSDALRAHKWHTLIGIIWGAIIWQMDRSSFWWFAPVLLGMVLSIPLSVFGSRRSWGLTARKMGLFLTPEEVAPGNELTQLQQRLESDENQGPAGEAGDPDERLTQTVCDPYSNAIHVSLLREKTINPIYAKELEEVGAGSEKVKELRQRLLSQGPSALSNQDKLVLMSDAEAMAWLHSRVWTEPGDTLSEWWRKALRRYGE